jgi:hypothetical protein
VPKILIPKSAYRRPDNPELIVQNMRYEDDPANTEDGASLSGRPALLLWKTGVVGSTRGVFYNESPSNNYALSMVSGTQIRAWNILNGSAYAYISGSVPGTEPVTMASIGQDSLSNYGAIATGTALYATNYSQTLQVALPDDFAATSVDASNQRYLVTRGNSQMFYWSDVNTTTFGALNFASAESEPDQLVAVKVIGSEIWLFGRQTIEVWQPSSNPDLPFQPIIGRNFAFGCIARQTIAKVENTLFWIGRQERIVLQTAPNPQRISDPAIEGLLRQANEADLNAFVAADEDGHLYYVVNMGAQGSWAYDVTTKAWSRWKTNDRTDFEGRYAAPFGDGRFVVGGQNGEVNFLTVSANNDNGKPIERRFSGWIDLIKTLRCSNVILDCTVGSNPSLETPVYIEMRWSDDRGKTWNVWESQPLGYAGDFDLSVIWSTLECQLGVMGRPGRLFEWRVSGDHTFMVRTAKFNERP